MADPLTHLCTALLPKALIGGRHTGAFAIGAVLPDLLSRVPSMLVERAIVAGAPLPAWSPHPFSVIHQPVGAAVTCVLLACLFREEDRRAVLGWLLGGAALHFAADVLQFHHGVGYHLWYPVSTARFELGWIGSESTVPLAPWLAALTAVAWGVRWAWDRRRSVDEVRRSSAEQR